MRSSNAAFVVALLSPFALATQAPAQTFHQWSGNGHHYAIVGLFPGQGWEFAKSDAEAKSGYLATLTSSAENDFVTALADAPAYWVSQFGAWNFGAYIGYSHPDGIEPHATGWRWVTGEPEGYTNWETLSNEPNDAGGHENYAHLHSIGDTRNGYWNDLDPAYVIQPNCYVLERNAVPEPATLAALSLGSMALRLAKRTRRKVGGRGESFGSQGGL